VPDFWGSRGFEKKTERGATWAGEGHIERGGKDAMLMPFTQDTLM